MCRDLRCALTHLRGADRGADILVAEEHVVLLANEVEANVERLRELCARAGIAPRHARTRRTERDRAIDRPGVEEAIAEPARELLGDRGFPCPCRSIDRDDDTTHRAPHIMNPRAALRCLTRYI